MTITWPLVALVFIVLLFVLLTVAVIVGSRKPKQSPPQPRGFEDRS